MNDEKLISIHDIKDGDIVLYELKEEHEFLPFTRENMSSNFYILIDKLICYAEKSKITHAALVYGSNKVIEAIIPNVRITDSIADSEYILHIRRVRNGKDGAAVLQYLPKTPEEISADPDSYAMIMSAVAALSCLFKAKIQENDDLSALSKIVRFVLFKVAEWIDNKKLPISSGDNNWFCSQLVYYTYTAAAVGLGDRDYEIKLPDASTPLTDTLIHRIIGRAGRNGLKSSLNLLEKPMDEEELFKLAGRFFNPDKNSLSAGKNEPSDEDCSFILSFMNRFITPGNALTDMEKELIKFQSAFVMPSDLRDCLSEGYLIKDE